MDGSFEVLKSVDLHKTSTGNVCAQVVNIRGIPYFGLKRSYFPPSSGEFEFSKPKPEIKGVYIPIEEWAKFLVEAVPQLDQEIKRQIAIQLAKASTKSTSAHQLARQFQTAQAKTSNQSKKTEQEQSSSQNKKPAKTSLTNGTCENFVQQLF